MWKWHQASHWSIRIQCSPCCTTDPEITGSHYCVHTALCIFTLDQRIVKRLNSNLSAYYPLHSGVRRSQVMQLSLYLGTDVWDIGWIIVIVLFPPLQPLHKTLQFMSSLLVFPADIRLHHLHDSRFWVWCQQLKLKCVLHWEDSGWIHKITFHTWITRFK